MATEFPKIVKILIDEDGYKIHSPKWCMVMDIAGGETALCDGQYFGEGESSVIYKVKKGKITCSGCIGIIKRIKNVRL